MSMYSETGIGPLTRMASVMRARRSVMILASARYRARRSRGGRLTGRAIATPDEVSAAEDHRDREQHPHGEPLRHDALGEVIGLAEVLDDGAADCVADQ